MTKKLVPVENHPHLARDPKTGAVLNINRTAISQAREAKRRRKEKEKKQEKFEERFELLESDMKVIRTMLEKLVENKDG